jgi:hypothetical protein
MAEKKEKAVYAPGELDRVRSKLGITDDREARRLAKLLGGEVGVERGGEKAVRPGKKPPSAAGRNGNGNSADSGRRRPRHRIELSSGGDEEETLKESVVRRPADPADDPLVPVKASYLERIKMDRFCALPEFRIKTGVQALAAVLSFFGEPPDLVNPAFITKKLNSYYKTLEQLVTSVRTLFPRNNIKRNEKFRRASPFSYAVLDVLRYWNLEEIASEMSKIQSHPRNIKVSELSGILKAVYRPLFILERMDSDKHIKSAFKMLYRILQSEESAVTEERVQNLIRDALISFNDVRQDIHYGLYPLLMKLLSDRFIPYESFFPSRRNRFMNFIGVSEADQIDPAGMAAEHKAGFPENGGEEKKDGLDQMELEEDPADPEAVERREKEAAREKERKAMLQGAASLEALFPKAGWERLSSFPDIYPYFRDIYGFNRNYELIAPSDPLLQVVVLMRILEDLFLGIRDIRFGMTASGDGGFVQVDEVLNGIQGVWRHHIDFILEREYLSRLSEYHRILEQSSESGSSNYARRLYCELQWIKRLFFFPYHKFDIQFPPPFQKKDIEPMYPAVRSLRRSLSLVAAGIEQANRIGGADKMVPCDGIDNPWEPYTFAIANPVSSRLDALLPLKKRNNATLIFFCLAFSTVLDHMVNNENSWVYRDNDSSPLRNAEESSYPEGEKIDPDVVFKESIRRRGESAQKPGPAAAPVNAPAPVKTPAAGPQVPLPG